MTEVTNKLSDDFTEEDNVSLKDYISNGCPGLVKLQDSDAFKCFELYMSGKTYSEISDITKIKRDTVLYLSHKSQWNAKKLAYFSDINNSLVKKMIAVKMESLNTMSSIASALNKYFAKKANDYLSTNDDSVLEGLDTKLLSQYYKAMESIETALNISGNSQSSSGSQININLNGPASIQQVDGNTIDLKDEDYSKILDHLASIKRENS